MTTARGTQRASGILAGLAVLLSAVSGCATPMTVQDYVTYKLLRGNPGFHAALEAANVGQTAFNLNADTPILEIREDEQAYQKMAEMLTRSRDAYRRASSYRLEGYSSALQPLKDRVRLTDLDVPRSERVSIPGMDIAFRVQANRERVDVMYVESARGLPVLRFDAAMKPTVTREFYPYLVGDRIEVGGDIREKIRRLPRPVE